MRFHALKVAISLSGLSLVAVTACNAPEHEPWTANDMNSEKMDEAKADLKNAAEDVKDAFKH